VETKTNTETLETERELGIVENIYRSNMMWEWSNADVLRNQENHWIIKKNQAFK
jgi:hypothetical protein